MLRFAIRTLAALTLFATTAQAQVISGRVTFSDDVALPESAVVDIALIDISRVDVGTVLAQAWIPASGPGPLVFRLVFDPTAVHPSRRYGVRAQVTDRDRIVFTTTQPSPVLTLGHGTDVQLRLRRVGSPAAASMSPDDVPAQAAELPVTALDRARARLSGSGRRPSAPSVMAALPATFTGTLPCDGCPGTRVQLNLFPDDSYVMRMIDQTRGATARAALGSWAVSSDGLVLSLGGRDGVTRHFLLRDALSLRLLGRDGTAESDSTRYDLRKSARFQPLQVSLEMLGLYRTAGDIGLFTECASGRTWTVEGGEAASALPAESGTAVGVLTRVEGRLADPGPGEPTLLVQRVMPTGDGSCAPRFSTASLDRTRWQLSRLGTDSAVGAGGGRMHMVFDTASYAFAAATGCNRVIGQFDTDGSAIALELGGTMRTCAETPTDQAFTAAILDTRSYRVVGRELFLYGEDGSVLAALRAGN